MTAMAISARRTFTSRSRRLWLVCLLLIAAGGGCASYDQHARLMREQFYASNLTGARETIDKVRKRHHKERDVLALEHAIVALADGQPKEAEKTLREVRDHFDYLEQQSAGELALSMITDDNRRGYAGEDYEKVLVRAFLAISNLMTDGGDAGAYALQVAEKQQQIIEAGVDKAGENPKQAYQRVALGPYIHGLLREQTHSNYDDAARDCAVVCSWQPDFPFGQQDLQRATSGRHSAPGNGVLYVFALVGRGPYKEQTVEMPTTAALLVADRILSATNKYTLPPTIAPVKVPKVVVPGSMVREVRVNVDRQMVGSTATISDIGQMAVQQYDAIFPRVLARAVVRRVVKKGIVLGAKEATGQSAYTLGSIVLDGVGIAWEASEAADTRSWSLLPDKIQVLRIELPAGTHQLALEPMTVYGTTGPTEAQEVTIGNGRNTYLLANFPDNHLVGKILSNQP
ncbi:MAG TPA: hypothetical protein VHY91_07915 [Pirellulales bacterium]|nr:hypothetical protein [Pirellulales bacterium]